MRIKREVLLFCAIGLLSLAGALLCLVATSLRLEIKYVGVTVGFFLAMLSVAKVQELRRAMRAAPIAAQSPPAAAAPRAFGSTRKAQLAREAARIDDAEDAELEARLAALRAKALDVPVVQPEAGHSTAEPAATDRAAPHQSPLDQRGDELRADIARLREGSRTRRAHPTAPEGAPGVAARAPSGGGVSVAPPGFLEELSMPAPPRMSVPAALAPQAPAAATKPAPASRAPADAGFDDPFARTQISGLEVTHVQSLREEEREAFAKTEFTDFGHADHGQFASTEYLAPPGSPRK